MDVTSKPQKRNLNINGITAYQQMASSCIGATLVSLFMTPLDVVKIRLQAQDRFMSKKCFLYNNGIMDHLHTRTNGEPKVHHTAAEICNCKWYNRPKYFNGTLDAFIKISKVEGIRSLWSGLSPTLVLAVPTTVVYFTTYEQLKVTLARTIPRPDENMTFISATSGALGRTWAVILVSPLELIRTKMQSQKMGFGDVRKALEITLRSEGITALWKGLSSTIIRDVPFSALYWSCYEYLRPIDFNFIETPLAGFIAGGVASAVTLPMDVIKTRFQLELGERGGGPNGGVKMSNVQVIRDIMKDQGWKGLYSGLVPRLLKVGPACAVMITSYEYCKQYFRQGNKSHYL